MTRSFTLLIACWLSLGCVADAPNDHAGATPTQPMPTPGQLTPATFEGRVTYSATIRHWIAIPEGKPPADGWPLLLFLHGSGERGDDLDLVLKWGPPKRIREARISGDTNSVWYNFPAVVVAPQLSAGRRWNPAELNALIDHVERTHATNPDRLYITGLSMGAFGTWALADLDPTRPAALVPVCGGYPYLPQQAAKDLKHIPIWAFHGDADTVVPVDLTTSVIGAIQDAGGIAKQTIFQGVGHVSWPMAYDMPELWQWLFEQRRSD